MCINGTVLSGKQEASIDFEKDKQAWDIFGGDVRAFL